MKQTLFGCFLVAIAIVSCKDKPVVVPPSDPGISYLTMDSGTVWNYQVDNITDTLTTTTNYSLEASNEDTTINTRIYKIFHRTDTSGYHSDYFNVTVNDYYQYARLNSKLPTTELKYLVNNAPLGTFWDDPFVITQNQAGVTVTVNATLRNSVEEKGSSVTVDSVTYDNVIKIKTEVINPTITSSLPVPLSIEPITQSIYAYYAPKYGLIKKEFQLNVDVNVLGTIQNFINTNKVTKLISTNIP